MRLFEYIKNIFSNTTKNSRDLTNSFLLYGNNRGITRDWAEVKMTDRDLYSGYLYSTIRNRSNAVACLAINNLRTESNNEGLLHPYLKLIDESKSFSNYKFWHDISLYIDLEGVYYLMAIRTLGKGGEVIGNVKEFKMLNPYNIRRIINPQTLELEGYIEQRGHLQREIPKNLIIEIRDTNPFDDNLPYSITDAMKESSYTIKTAGDYTRHALRNNINAPGILSTDVVLPDRMFHDFVERVRSHTKGEPLFSNGTGGIVYTPMQQNLKDVALDVVNKLNREELFAISGVSKTIMGIEESGTTRETSKTQKEIYIENQIIPRLQMIIDALNQDFKNNYQDIYKSTQMRIIINNPLSIDKDIKLKDTQSKMADFELYQKLLDYGYDVDISQKFVNGDVGIDKLGEPNRKNKQEEKVVKNETLHNICSCGEVHNALNVDEVIQEYRNSLVQSIIKIEQDIVKNAINRIKNKYTKKVKNQIEQIEEEVINLEEADIMTNKEKKSFINELSATLTVFYSIVSAYNGRKTILDRMSKYGGIGGFKLNKEMLKDIKNISEISATSHVETMKADVYDTAQKQALKGKGVDRIIKELIKMYSDQIDGKNAKTIAMTESNRAFTFSQYNADKQFIAQNNLEGRVYKKWVTRSGNPCIYCQKLESEPPIPFNTEFRALGESVSVDNKELFVNFLPLEYGNAHPNCACTYELIVKPSVSNSADQTDEFLKKEKIEKEKRELVEIIKSLI